MTIKIYKFPLRTWFARPESLAIALDIDGEQVWIGPEQEILFYVDRYHQLWLYPLHTRVAVLMDAIYPEEKERLQELADQMADDRSTFMRQATREIHDLLVEQSDQLSEKWRKDI